MLRSDGMTRAQFLALWHESLWHVALEERARLTLELDRATVREDGKAPALVVALSPGQDEPLTVIPLADAPRPGDPARAALQQRLVAIGADEVYVTVTIQTGAPGGVPAYLLAVWAEAADGTQACWMMPFRWSGSGLEEADPLMAPVPSQTVFARELGGLLSTRH